MEVKDMARISDEDIQKFKDEMRKQYDYDSKTDDEKAEFDQVLEKVAAQKKAEYNGTDNTDDTDEDDRGDSIERSPGPDAAKENKTKEPSEDEEKVKAREMEMAKAQMAEKQRMMDAERQRKAEEAEKKEKEEVER